MTDGTSPLTAVERAERGGGCLSVRGGLGQSFLLGGQRLVLVGVLERGGVDLVELIAQQVGLARSGAVVAAERVELGLQGAPPGAGLGEGPEVGPGEGVQGASLCGGVEKGLLGVLPVQLEQPGPGLGQRRDRGHPAVDPGS